MDFASFKESSGFAEVKNEELVQVEGEKVSFGSGLGKSGYEVYATVPIK